jgi:hypothetical protein
VAADSATAYFIGEVSPIYYLKPDTLTAHGLANDSALILIDSSAEGLSKLPVGFYEVLVHYFLAGASSASGYERVLWDHRDKAAGTGDKVCSLWVYDTGASSFVSDIMVSARNTSGALQGMNRTNATGISVLYLLNGSYNLTIPMNSGYIQTTNPQSLTVSGNTNDTINVTWFSPSAAGGDLCVVYNYIKDGSDNPIAGVTVTAKIPSNFWPVTYSGQAFRATVSTKTDGNGKWELPVYPNSLVLTTDGDSASYWQFTDSKKLFGDYGYKVTVPDSATFFMVPDDD